MAMRASDPETVIRALPIWTGGIVIQPLLGGITNKNYLVRDAARRVVLRFGGDIPVHGVMRFNELAASRAAAEAGISPKVIYAAPNLMALDFIEGKSYGAEDVRADRERCLALVKRVHRELPAYLRGPTLAFNVFQIIRDYAHTLSEDQSRMAPQLPRFLGSAAALERAVGSINLVFGHNDLLASNFLDDGKRLWLIDWDYAGWTSPLFDLGGLASNNGFDQSEIDAMLAAYFEAPVTDALRRKFHAMLCASLLREAMWSMVSEHRSTIDFDYAAYSDENLRRFDAAWAAFQEME
ncbi:MAG: choline/ethanolamine kinase family protein [Methylocystis sp.]